MRLDTAKGLEDISRGQEVSEGSEHADRRVEHFPQFEGSHVGSEESWCGSRSRGLLPRLSDHSAGQIDPGDAVSTAGQEERMVSGSAPQVHDGLRLHAVPPEDLLEKVYIAFVVDDSVIDQVVISCKPRVTRTGRPSHDVSEFRFAG